jgi:hypothetical protein
MLPFHDNSVYRDRATMAWASQSKSTDWQTDTRNYFAGYCIDALELLPAGSTIRVDPNRYVAEPFAAQRSAYRRA